MSMTMTQKILAAHAGLQSVTAGQLIEAKLDLVLGNDEAQIKKEVKRLPQEYQEKYRTGQFKIPFQE